MAESHFQSKVIEIMFTTWNLVQSLAGQLARFVTDLSSLVSLAPDTTNAWLEKLEVNNYSDLTQETCYTGEALCDCPGAIVYLGNLLVFCYWTSTCTAWLIFLSFSQSDSCLSSLADHSCPSLWPSWKPSTRNRGVSFQSFWNLLISKFISAGLKWLDTLSYLYPYCSWPHTDKVLIQFTYFFFELLTAK